VSGSFPHHEHEFHVRRVVAHDEIHVPGSFDGAAAAQASVFTRNLLSPLNPQRTSVSRIKPVLFAVVSR